MRHRRYLEESMKFIESTLTSAVVLLLAFPPAVSIAKSATAETPAQIFKQVSPSVVVVHVSDSTGKGIALGSGVVIERGVVITNCHVAEAGQKLEVSLLKTAYAASVRYADPDRDLCELSVPKLLAPPVTFGDSQHLEVGQRVYAVGAPEGLELSLSEGLVSSVRSSAGLHFIQTTASISPGSSGGGLFDDHGRLVGITTFYVTEGQNLNFALPADWIHGIAERAKATAQATSKAQQVEVSRVMKVMALEVKSDWPGALSACQQWVKAQPDSIWAWECLGEAYEQLREYEKAVQAYQRAAENGTMDTWAWSQLGASLDKLNRYNEAAEAYLNAVRLDTADSKTWVGLGLTYGVLHNYGDAVEALQTALRLDPQNASAWAVLGMVYEELDEYGKAAEADEQAVQLNPKDATSWGGLGLAYGKLRENQKASEALERAVTLNPADAYSWFNLGVSYCGLGQRDKVINVYQRLQILDQESANKLFNACIAP
jgi:tetratricopeptide (TPR) repeat protein